MTFLEFGFDEIRHRWGGYGNHRATSSSGSSGLGGPSSSSGGMGGPSGTARPRRRRHPTRRGGPLGDAYGGTDAVPGTGVGSDDSVDEPEVDEGETKAQKDLRAELRDLLDRAGMATPGLIRLIEQAVREDWSATKFIQEWRQHPDYLANPLFKANLERAKEGNRFMSEGEVIAYATDLRDIARSYGYKEPSLDKIAGNILTGKSKDEFRHQLDVEQRIKMLGGGVAMLWKAYTGDDPTDEELHAVFNKEIDSASFERFARRSEMRGRPLILGLDIRSEAEAQELEQLGYNPDQAFEGYKRIAESLPTVSRIAAIDDAIAKDPENRFDSFGALFGDIFRSDPKEQERLMLLLAREKSRWQAGGAPRVSSSGQQLALLSGEERSTFG